MNTMPCQNCAQTMSWQGTIKGWYCVNCGYSRAAQTPTGEVRETVENVVSSETIIGCTTGPVWTITCTAKRLGVEHYVETLHVRAISYDGAILLAKEMVLDWIDGDAEQVTQ